LSLLIQTEQEFATAYSKEENAIVERANKEVMRHLRAIILNQRVLKKWSSDQLPLVMRILNSKEKNDTGVFPAELLFGNTVDLGRELFRRPLKQSSRDQPIVLTEYTENLLTKQKVLLELAKERQRKHDA